MKARYYIIFSLCGGLQTGFALQAHASGYHLVTGLSAFTALLCGVIVLAGVVVESCTPKP